MRATVGLVAACILPACGGGSPSPSPSAPPAMGAGSWASAARLLEPRQEVGTAELGGRIYVVGGFRADGSSANTVEVYDPATDRWSIAAPMPLGLNHPMAAATSGRLYVFGGDIGGGPVPATLEYDPQTNSWAVRSPMPTARSAAMAAVIGGRIYVAGGSPAAAGRVLEAYEPAADRWTPLPSMPTPRNHVAGGALGGRLYVVGGRPPLTLDAVEAFDPASATWSARAPLPTGRSGHAAAVVRGCLYILGGEGNAGAPSGVFPQNEVYDPRTNTWETLAPMPTPRHGIGAAVLGERIFVPGGANVQGFGATGAHEVFTVPMGRSCS